MNSLQTKKIAGTSIQVSPLGIGTVKFGRNQGVKYPYQFTIPDDHHLFNLLTKANQLGINLLDTAPAYGTSEERLGKLFSEHKGLRNQWIICSKAGEEFQDGISQFNFSPEHIRFSVERSLKRLNTDVIELLLIHSNGDDVRIIKEEGCLEVLADLKREGKILASGMSTKTVNGGILALQNSDVAMVTYSLKTNSEKPVIDYAHEHQKGILIKKLFASGSIHYADDSPIERINESMDLVFSHPGVSAAIIGTINLEHLKQNYDACLRIINSINL